jgi:osmotically-inducible protein OsmY
LIGNYRYAYRRRNVSSKRSLNSWALAVVMTGLMTGCAADREFGSGGDPSDNKITTDVRGLLDQHPDLGPPNDINVRAQGGVVYLSGLVSSDLMSESAVAVAHEAPGVAKVVNSIAVQN